MIVQDTMVPKDAVSQPLISKCVHRAHPVQCSLYCPPVQDAASWEALKEIQICWSGAFVTATHSCSYTCFISQFGPAGAAEQSSCWLSPQPEDAVGSACPGWPAGYPGMVGGAH